MIAERVYSMLRDTIIDRLPSLALTRRFLFANGWSIKGDSDKYTLLANDVDGEPFEFILAKNEHITEWQKTVSDVIISYSDYFAKGVDEIIFAISSVRHDVLRSKISDRMVRNETIDLDTAVEYVSGLKNLMISAAAAEVRQEQTVLRAPQQAAEYGKSCRFGHTFRGSFGFVVESPMIIEAQDVNPVFFDATTDVMEPFERKVIKRLAKGFSAIDHAFVDQDTSLLINGYEEGCNANVLDALLELHKAAKFSRVAFEFAWSPELPNREIIPDFGFSLGSDKIELLETASRELKQEVKPEREVIFGYVTDLHNDAGLESDNIFNDDRKVVVKLYNAPEYKGRKLHIPLPKESYQQAIDAHKNGIEITAEGKMVKQGRHWYLLDTDKFKILK